MPRAGLTAIQSNDTSILGQISDAWPVYQKLMEKYSAEQQQAPPPEEEEEEEGPKSSATTSVREIVQELPVRVAWVGFWNTIEFSPRLPEERNYFLWTERVKVIMDGSLGAGTAALLEPYTDDASSRGLLSVTSEELETSLRTAYAKGYRLEAHSIGDRSFQLLLEKLENGVPYLDRLVFTHCQILNPDLLQRLKRLCNTSQTRRGSTATTNQENVSAFSRWLPSWGRGPSWGGGWNFFCQESKAVAENNKDKLQSDQDNQRPKIIGSIQPQFTNSDLPILEEKLGHQRLECCYAWKSIRKTGCVLSGGSDAPVERMAPLEGMRCAMRNALHRSYLKSDDVDARQDDLYQEIQSINKKEDLSFAETLALYTRNSAFSAGVSDSLGVLDRGFFADFVVLDVAASCSPSWDWEQELSDAFLQPNGVRVHSTYVGGKKRYDSSEISEREAEEDFALLCTSDTNAPGRGGLPIWKCPCCFPDAQTRGFR
ncbi:unnamed protein product [Amoebophrya sp. A25]|nr:unnamed protein product [Amoebophrya sp. A25]|eukprot:GSA25T00003740001.1